MSAMATYRRSRPRLVAIARQHCPTDAEDIVQDAAIDAVARDGKGQRTDWRIAIRTHARRHIERRARLDIGLPLHLRDAAELADTVEARRRLRAAQRVLRPDELNALLAEYDRPDARSASRIRIARRRLRRERC